MSVLYTRTAAGTAVFAYAEAKVFLKIPVGVTSDDTLITGLIDAATEWGEAYTGRSFRAQTFELLRDDFEHPLELRRSMVDAITTVEHLVDESLVEVSSDDYYLKLGRWWSQIWLAAGSDWPTTTDDIQHGVKVTFTTAAWADTNTVKTAIKMHVAYLYENRGDNDERTDVASAARLSGATALYDAFRIPRF